MLAMVVLASAFLLVDLSVKDATVTCKFLWDISNGRSFCKEKI